MLERFTLTLRLDFGWHDSVKHPNHCELDNQGTFITLFLVATVHDGYRVRAYCTVLVTLSPHQGNDRIATREHGEAPTR